MQLNRPGRVVITDEQWAQALRLRRRNMTLRQIGEAFGCSKERMRSEFHARGKTTRDNRKNPDLPPARRVEPNQQAMAERDYRRTLTPRNLTAEFFGDPLPGYSALERRA